MASFSGPKLSNRIADDVPDIQAMLSSLAQLTPDSGNTDYPIGTKRVAETNNGYEFQQWNGSSWVHLEKWNINAQKVDGYSASTGTTASTIPVRGAGGKIAGDITGNASTASSAVALSATNPIDKGGTGATTAAQARANLVVPPKSHASSSSEFGAGSSTQYGHLKSHDEPDSTLTAASGHAFSPAGAASMKTELEEQIEEVETEASAQVSSLDTSLRALIAEEVGDAASEASSQLSSLDSTLRALIAGEVAKKLSKSGDVLSGPLKIKGTDGSTYTIFPNQDAHCLVIAALDSNGKEKNAFYLHTDVPAVVMRSYADNGTSVDIRLAGNDKKAYLANQALLTANATAYAATRTPNVQGVAFSGSSYTLPAGGSWSAFFVDTTASYCGGWVTVAGGTVLNLGVDKQWRGLIARNN